VSPEWDVQVEAMELPYLFRTTVPQLPMAESYLDLPQHLQHAAAQWMGPRRQPRVAVVWSTGEWNRSRALPFSFVEELARDLGIEFWNLQGGPEHDDWHRLPAADNLRDATGFGDGILKLAAIIQQMDLVITADTLAAHLAGAMGKPAWMVLQHAADWRWMVNRADSPWYPSLRLFRQPSAGDWAGTLHQVSTALAQWKQAQP
jgi:ADP-heptose:LPS heptosyltransferase